MESTAFRETGNFFEVEWHSVALCLCGARSILLPLGRLSIRVLHQRDDAHNISKPIRDTRYHRGRGQAATTSPGHVQTDVLRQRPPKAAVHLGWSARSISPRLAHWDPTGMRRLLPTDA
jgi:hypothetical protein